MKMPFKVTRREFLAIAAGAAGGLGAARIPDIERRAFPRGARRIRFGPGAEMTVATTCTLCPAGCGVLARIVDGHVVKLEGNPLNPINRGRLCALGQAGVQLLYHPDRIRQPLRRIGPKGSPQFEPISWAQAGEILKQRLLETYQAGRGHEVVALDGGGAMTRQLWARLLEAIGSPNHILDRAPDPSESACFLTQGIRARPSYDFAGARFVLSLGAPLLESWWSPVQIQRVYADRASASGRSRMKIVHFDTRFSATAALADEWYPVKPGGFLALALSFAYVIVKESLHDQEFVAGHTAGFLGEVRPDGSRRLGFRDLLLRDCNPDRLAPITGVPAGVVHRLAKELAHDRPSFAVGDAASTDHPQAVQAAWAIHCLNALVGAIDVPGTVIYPEPAPLAVPSPLPADALADRGLKMDRIDGAGGTGSPAAGPIDRLAEALVSDAPYAASVVFLHHANPMYSAPDPDRFDRALRKVPLVVSFTPFHDETLKVADLVLPDATWLERWENVEATAASGQTVVGVVQPVILPRHDTLATADFLIGLMKTMGPRFAAAAPWQDAREHVVGSHRSLFESARGTVFTEDLEAAQLAAIEERGWWFPTRPEVDSFLESILATGGWWDPVYQAARWGRVLRTPSGRFEFRSSGLESWVQERVAREQPLPGQTPEEHRIRIKASLGLTGTDDVAWFPRVPEVAAGDRSGPALRLVAYRPLTRSGAVLGLLPILRDVLGVHLGSRPIFWVEVAPADAGPLGLETGSWVRVETDVGSIEARVRVVEANPPGVVAIPYGYGQEGRGGVGIGANVCRLLPVDLDPIGRTRGWRPVEVRLVPLEGGGRHG